jgi:hypothetical protein
VFSDEFIAIPPRQIGIHADEGNELELRALSLFLSSNFCIYHQFLSSPQWGIDRNRADLHALLDMPIPIKRLTAPELREWGQIHKELAEMPIAFSESQRSELLDSVNDRVFGLLQIRKAERWLVDDFVNLHMEMTKGKATPAITRSPASGEMQQYIKSLRECLDGFLSDGSGLRHKIDVLVDRESALIAVSLVTSRSPIEPSIEQANSPASRDLKAVRNRLRSQHSQWVYFDRNLKVYDRRRGILCQFKPLQRLHWTRRQAVLDADDIIAETLSEGELQ